MDYLIKKLDKSLSKRKNYIEKLHKEGTNIFRLFSGVFEGIRGLIIDCFGKLAIISIDIDSFKYNLKEIKLIADWCYKEVGGIESVCLKKLSSKRHCIDPNNFSPHSISGALAQEKIIAHEWGLKYYIRPFDGNLVGFFHDQRNNRKFLSKLCQQKNVLNTFSYTSSFSVILAKYGATVTSVDLSSKHICWGKENFKLNNLSLENHLFIATDVFSYIKMAVKKGITYDMIILDPPSFSRTKKGHVFSISKDFEKLFKLILNLAKRGTLIFISVNYLKWNRKVIKEITSKVLKETKLMWKYIALPPIPKDFIGTKSFPKSFLIELN